MSVPDMTFRGPTCQGTSVWTCVTWLLPVASLSSTWDGRYHVRDSEFLWSCGTPFLLTLLDQCFPHRNFRHFLLVAFAVHCCEKVKTIRARRRHASFPSLSLCFDLQEQLYLPFLQQRMWTSSQNVFFQEKGKLKGNSYSSSAAVGSRGLGPCLIHVCVASFQEEHHLRPFRSPCSH